MRGQIVTAEPSLFDLIDAQARINETHAKLHLVADPGSPVGRDAVAAFLTACEADARTHDGIVSVNRVSAALPEDITSTERYSSFWSHFTGKGKPMVKADGWEIREGSRSGNDGKPVRLRRWIGC